MRRLVAAAAVQFIGLPALQLHRRLLAVALGVLTMATPRSRAPDPGRRRVRRHGHAHELPSVVGHDEEH